MNFKMVVDRNHFMVFFTPLKKRAFLLTKENAQILKLKYIDFFLF